MPQRHNRGLRQCPISESVAPHFGERRAYQKLTKSKRLREPKPAVAGWRIGRSPPPTCNSDEDFHDVFAECHPNSPGFTYACRNRYVDPSWTIDERIDYIFANRDLVPQECSVVFDGNNGFDFVSIISAYFAGSFFVSQLIQ